ncbi:MAG: GDSL-type esterase/lipase family protein [Bacteroidales bacterium]|nr:GDSL-type esterase/lipase family protein [Bacteroidales bacterium]
MKKVLFVIIAFVLAAWQLSAQTPYKAQVDSLVALAPAYNEYNTMRRGLFNNFPIGRKDIVFFGDSITDRCEWADLFGNNKHIRNRGISGDRVRWMFDRYEQIAEGKPAKIFFLAGVNDIRNHTHANEVFMMTVELMARIHEISPKTKIYVESLLPIRLDRPANAKFQEANLTERIDKCNGWLKEWCDTTDYVTFIDVASSLKDENGEMIGDYTIDGLHPNFLGYSVWKSLIEKYVK